MNKKYSNKIFNLNNILIAAFGINSGLGKSLIEENDALKDDVNTELVKEYLPIKNGAKLGIKSSVNQTETDEQSLIKKGLWTTALLKYAKLLKEKPDDIELIKRICIILAEKNAYQIIKKLFIKQLLAHTNDDPDILYIIARTYVQTKNRTKDFTQKSMPAFEKLIEIKPETPEKLFEIAWLYERLYQDKYLNLQIKYCEEALQKLSEKEQNNVRIFLGELYYRNGEKEKADEQFNIVLKTDKRDELILRCAIYKIETGNLTEGYYLYRCRFRMGTTYPVMLTDKTRWNGQDDISDSTVIIHYEQGFGDSIMFSRYVEDIAKMAKKTIFVVQKNIIPLFKASGFDKYCTILPHEADLDPNIKMKGCSKKGEMYAIGCGMGMIEHEYHIPMMDTPYLLKETSSNIRKTEGYLKVSEEKVEKYRKKHINKNNKIKIGVAYHGTDDAALSYRDIPANKFLPLIKMENVEVYGFQADKYASELSRYTKKYHVKNLGKTFKNFETTACAIECMDVIISTDNVVMNLAGALGKKAYALFNVYPEFRWFKTEGEDIGWYKSVKPFRAKTFNDWENVIKDVKAQLIKDFNLEDKK